MSRDRYFSLRVSLKVVFDNEISREERVADRIWKIRPIVDRIVEGCQKQPRSQKNLSFDEMMIPFTGACPIKQYVPNKPNPVGLKVYVLSNPSGIACDLFIYEEKKHIQRI